MKSINKDKKYKMFVDCAIGIFLNDCDSYAEIGIKENGKSGLIQGEREE